MDFLNIDDIRTPTTIAKIAISISSVLNEGEPDDDMLAIATVLDQYGDDLSIHKADHTRLIELGLMTVAERDQLRAFVQTFRARVEALLMSS